MEKFYYIYKITITEGTLKDHYYIGQHVTTNLDDGYKGSGVIISNYYKKYPNSYKKEILNFFNNQDELNEAEKYYIGDKYKTDELCLNLCGGGGGVTGYKLTEEQRKKVSEKGKGRTSPMKGKHWTDESKNKLSKSIKGRKLSEEHKQKISDSNIGKHYHDEESRKKISEHRKGKGTGKPKSEEQKQKISEALKGRKMSEEQKNKLRKSKSEEHKQKISKTLKGRHLPQETKDKISAATKGYHWTIGEDGKRHYYKN